jgi:hypothetical protein
LTAVNSPYSLPGRGKLTAVNITRVPLEIAAVAVHFSCLSVRERNLLHPSQERIRLGQGHIQNLRVRLAAKDEAQVVQPCREGVQSRSSPAARP